MAEATLINGTVPVDGFGTYLETSADGTTWSGIGNLIDIKPPEKKTSDIKTTTHSTANKTHTYRPGLAEPGETEVTLLFDGTALTALDALFQVADQHFRITFTDGTTIAALGYINSIKPIPPMDGDATIDVKIKHSGPWTSVAGT